MKKHGRSFVWEISYYVDSRGRCPFQEWFLRDLNLIQQIALRKAINNILLETISLGLKSPSIKSLRDGVYEYRLSMSQKELVRLLADFPDIPRVDVSKLLLRVFYTLGPNHKIVILSGYDKLADSHKRAQQSEINRAKKLRRNWQQTR
jgi:putative component of toxin-antitoxin plasmid stabilization module